MKKLVAYALLATGLAAAALAQAPKAPRIEANFAAARKGFATTIHYDGSRPATLPKPPAGVFDLVHYPAQPGQLAAYVTPDPSDGKKHPAIIWVTGGESNTLGVMWRPEPRSNDQSAAAYRQAGVVLMAPSLRGGNDNPGKEEAGFGEVDDLIAAADYLSRLPYVDPQRIYLGGHSTGGTLALLTAETSSRFRAVFAFGPVFSAADYPRGAFPIELSNFPQNEQDMRSPGLWLASVKSPVIVIEGKPDDGAASNWRSLEQLQRASHNPRISFVLAQNANHFSVLAPGNEVIARKILADTRTVSSIKLDASEISQAMAAGRRAAGGN